MMILLGMALGSLITWDLTRLTSGGLTPTWLIIMAVLIGPFYILDKIRKIYEQN